VSETIVPLDHQLLTAEEVAELLRLPVSTIYDLPEPDGFPTSRSGGPCDSAGAISRCTLLSAAAPRSRLGSESAA
jgi:hypothetical protein